MHSANDVRGNIVAEEELIKNVVFKIVLTKFYSNSYTHEFLTDVTHNI